MATQWFFTERGEQRGPIAFDELKARADQGSLRPDDLVWSEGMPDWKQAAQVDGLLPQSSAAPPPLPGQSSGGPPYESWDASYSAERFSSDFSAMDADSRQWALLLHLSQLLNFVLPPTGWIVPILIWQLKKDELPALDAHGKNIANWIISSLIYLFGSALLCVVLIGVPLIIALLVCKIVFPIIGGIKANKGVVWKYPMAIGFFK